MGVINIRNCVPILSGVSVMVARHFKNSILAKNTCSNIYFNAVGAVSPWFDSWAPDENSEMTEWIRYQPPKLDNMGSSPILTTFQLFYFFNF